MFLFYQVTAAKTDHLAVEREDVNKLLADLIGGSGLSSQSSSSSVSAVPSSPPKSPVKTTPAVGAVKGVASRSRKVKLNVDTLAQINIKPKVSLTTHVSCDVCVFNQFTHRSIGH